MPGFDSGAQGIIIVNSMPGPGASAEGIIVVNGIPGFDNISQVMGIIMEDKPGDDGGSQGIIVVDSMPGPDSGAQGIIVVDSMPGSGGSSQGIIIVNSMPGENGIAQPGLPFGFDMGEGMTAMMGEGGFGPGPYLVGKLELTKFGFPAELGPGEKSCIQITLFPSQGENLVGPDPYYPADSFFDVFFELDTTKPQRADSASSELMVVQVPLPSLLLCTPIPSVLLPTATPTRPPTGPPTNTPYVRPTNTPYVRPTNTPGRPAPTPTTGRGG